MYRAAGCFKKFYFWSNIWHPCRYFTGSCFQNVILVLGQCTCSPLNIPKYSSTKMQKNIFYAIFLLPNSQWQPLICGNGIFQLFEFDLKPIFFVEISFKMVGEINNWLKPFLDTKLNVVTSFKPLCAWHVFLLLGFGNRIMIFQLPNSVTKGCLWWEPWVLSWHIKLSSLVHQIVKLSPEWSTCVCKMSFSFSCLRPWSKYSYCRHEENFSFQAIPFRRWWG